jgi:hypothetical protein
MKAHVITMGLIRGGPRRSPRAIFMLLVAVLLGQGLAPAHLVAASTPSLHLTYPTRVAVGAPISITLTLRDASDVAGYETQVAFDPSVATFDGLRQRANDLPRNGRDVSPLGPVEQPTGIAFGFYSCPTVRCLDTINGARPTRGARGTVRLATLLIRAYQPGTLELRIANARFVDATGQPFAASIPAPIRVQVGAANAGPLFRAPAIASRAATQPARPGRLDLTRDQVVSHADAMEIALAWTRSREQGNGCGARAEAAVDVNVDGCVDVADLQTVAAHMGAVERRSGTSTTTQEQTPSSPSAESVTPMATLTVDTPQDSNDINIGDGQCVSSATSVGKCTLRAAIQEANARAGADTIRFAIPGSGVQTITLKSSFPALSDATGPTTIDGYTQPGAAANTDALLSNARIMVQIVGAGPSTFDAIAITAPNNLVRGLAIYNLRRPFLLYGSGAQGNVIVGNFIGTNASGTFGATTSTTNANGVDILQGANRTRIGGTSVADRNIISGNARHGISTYNEGSDANVIMNNIVGLGPRGDKRLPNLGQGIDINAASSYNVIGGETASERNVISGNLLSGVELSHDTQTVSNRIVGNYIGTGVNGTAAGSSYTANKEWGIHIEDGASNNLVRNNVVGNNQLGGIKLENYYTYNTTIRDNRIGIGTDGSAIPNAAFGVQVEYHAQRQIIGPNNIIANNPIGVWIDYLDDDYNTITRNQIYNNTRLGIDLGPGTGVTPNDSGDADNGSNNQLNFPVLTSATRYEVKGTACVDAAVPKPCTVEVFIAERRTTDQGQGNYGQGRTFVGSAVTAADGSFTVTTSVGIGVGSYVTATATDASGNTSEFALNRVVVAGTTPYAVDTFARTVANGWGTANIGGAYTLNGPSTNFSVDGSGRIVNSTTNSTRAAYLQGISARDINATFRVRKDKSVAGGAPIAYFIARRVGATTEYRARLRWSTNGQLLLMAERYVNGTQTLLGSERVATGLTDSAQASVRVRIQVVGSNPTTIRIRAWADGQSEPGTWQYNATDSTASLQNAGAIGLQTYLATTATNAPLTFSFDDLVVAAPSTP